MTNALSEALEVLKRTCNRCQYSWTLRVSHEPTKCPKCGSPYWNKPRRTPRVPKEKQP